MQEPENRNDPKELIEAAKTEITAMGKQGIDHPSSKPVLVGAAIGAVVGYFLLGGSWFVGLLVGAAIALYQRIKK